MVNPSILVALFIKPTAAGRSFIENPEESPPYSGAKPYFLVDDRLEDGDWLCELVQVTVKELPEGKAKKPRKKKR